MTYSSNETPLQARQDLILGLSFLVISAFSSVRVFRSIRPVGGRKVIATFNFLIFISAFSRAIWFLLPNYLLEPSYAPAPLVAYKSTGWFGLLTSEILLELGSLGLYGIFILVACYWVHMLAKLDADSEIKEVEDESLWTRLGSMLRIDKRGTIQMFLIIMSVVGVLQLLGILLYLCQLFNSEQMILYDSLLLSALSVAIVVKITMLSNKIKGVLQNLEAINHRNSQPQIRRIYAIIIVAHIFFISRVLLELTLSVSLIVLMKEKHSFSVLLSDEFWGWYILIKHASEVLVLGLELVISTAIRAYDTSGVAARPQHQGLVSGKGSVSIRNSGSVSHMSDRSSNVAYSKVPNYSSMEMASTASAENTPLYPSIRNNLRSV